VSQLAVERTDARLVVTRTAASVVVALVAANLAVFASAAEAARPVVIPLLAILDITVVFLTTLYRRERVLPVFDLGAFTAMTTALYSGFPLFAFWMAGLTWTPISYLPLYQHSPDASDAGAFAWRHVLYLGAFVCGYLALAPGRADQSTAIRGLRRSAQISVILLTVTLLLYFRALQSLFGVTYEPSYVDLEAATAAIEATPLPLQQLSHNLYAILFLLKLVILLWLMTRWNDWRWRTVLFVWLAVEGATTVSRMGGRTWFVMLIAATVLLYHRLVQPLRVWMAAAAAGVLIAGAIAYGLARDVGGGIATVAASEGSPWAAMNEFQALFGIAYDLFARKAAGTLGAIPWQVYANDFLIVVPSQILPFPKADPCIGYPQVDGIGLGCVLGVVSNAVIGLDWVELAARGLVLGFLFAAIHRWYKRHRTGYWATLFYLCLCLWSYYTFRASTFYLVYFVVYRFLPMLVAVRAVQMLVEAARRGMPRAPAVRS
jgi:hypothetical protein